MSETFVYTIFRTQPGQIPFIETQNSNIASGKSITINVFRGLSET